MSSETPRRWPRSLSFGQVALASLLLALITGAPLALAYDAVDAEASLQLIRIGNRSARILRALHAWTGHLFLIVTLLHTIEHLLKRSQARLGAWPWLRVVLLIPLALAVMLTGFLLRGDADAQLARRILEGLLARLDLPGLRHALLGQGDLSTLYLHHVFTAALPLWIITVEHARRRWPRAGAVLLALTLASPLAWLLPPGLHDGVEALKTGPWYFLGLQEALHWLPEPEWSLILGAAGLLALFALRWRPRSRWILGGLALALLLYAGLSLVAALWRGPGWVLRGSDPPTPSRAKRDHQSLDLSAPLDAPPPRVQGRVEGCLICHEGVTGFTPAHQSLGCSACHLGDPLTRDESRAHQGLVRVPGNLDAADLTCGRCHPEWVERVRTSLMATGRGMVAVDRFVFGEQATPDGAATLAELGSSPADQHLRQLCARCHLANPKLEPAPLSELSRGGGCVACHLQDPTARAPFEADRPYTHPALTLQVTDQHCFGCHSRSGRVSLSYQGLGETLLKPEEAGEGTRVLQDGRVLAPLPADVHHERGMGCVDCHTARGVMGDGQRHLHQEEAVEIACEDCHPREAPEITAAGDLDAETRALIRQRGARGEAPYVRARRSGRPLSNVRWVEGRVRVDQKAGERAWWPKPPVEACSAPHHARISCRSCHASWAHHCVTCHTRFDPEGASHDSVTRAPLPGRFRERRDAPRFEAPTLGLRGEGRVEPFAPGMVMRLLDEDWRLYAPVAPHTTAATGRDCRSCHADPLTLGYGRGRLILEEGAPPRFEPALEALGDGLPADAWIGVLGARGGLASTRSDARPLSVEIQRRVLRVGACLGCHEGDEAWWARFEAAIAGRPAECGG